MNSRALVAIGLISTVAILCGGFSKVLLAEAKQKPFLDNEELIETARSLESAELLQDDISSEMVQKRLLLQYNYARTPKSVYAKDQFEKVVRLSNDYKFKAYEFVNDNKKSNKNWFTNFKKIIGPMGAMKNLAKNYPFLQEVNQRYETQAKDGLLTNADVDCDTIKFQISQLYNIYFALQTDIKYLLLGDQQILNRAIYEQIKADKFSSPHNFYEAVEINDKQRALLFKYFSDHSNQLVTNIGNAVDHFYNPSEFITGRLLDTCQAANQYQSIWRELESNRAETCSNSQSDRGNNQFSAFYSESKYEDLLQLCHGLFEAF